MKQLFVIFSMVFGIAFFDLMEAKAQMCPTPSNNPNRETTTRTRTQTSRRVIVTPRNRTRRVNNRRFWVDGFYTRSGNQYVWNQGYYTNVYNNRVYIPACYVQERGRWRYVPGRWRAAF